MRRFFLFLTAFLALSGAASAQTSNRPLVTEVWDCLEPGQLRVEFGAEYLETPSVAYRFPEGSLLRAPVLGFTVGAAERVELQAEGVLHEWADPEEGDEVDDYGDFFLWMKWAFFKAKRAPSLGLRWGVKLPNSDDRTGLGKDRTDFFAHFIATKHFRRVSLHANAGLGILERVEGEAAQDDVILYGAAAVFGLDGKGRWFLSAEAAGHSGTGETPPNGTGRLALERRAKKWSADIGGFAGLTDESPDWGVSAGATRTFQVFKKKK
jgi:hypothetical protein